MRERAGKVRLLQSMWDSDHQDHSLSPPSGKNPQSGGGALRPCRRFSVMANLVEKTLGKALGAIFKNFSPDKLEMVTLFEANSTLTVLETRFLQDLLRGECVLTDLEIKEKFFRFVRSRDLCVRRQQRPMK